MLLTRSLKTTLPFRNATTLLLLTVMAVMSAVTAASAQTPQIESGPTTNKPASSAVVPSARTVVDGAVARAASTKKGVLIVFHASWCGWCHRLDDVLLNDPQMGKLLREQYEIVHLDVAENGPKKALENPGGAEIREQWGGAQSGLPYYVFLDAQGKKVTDSIVDLPVTPKDGGKPAIFHTNIGYPSSPEEIKAFGRLLRQTAPRMSAADRGRVVDHLKKNAPKPSASAVRPMPDVLTRA